MAGRNRREVPPELSRARDRFQAWRRTRTPKSRIPDRLWALAVKLTAAHGLNRTARTLNLDYYSLKKRVDVTSGQRDSSSHAFVELPPPIAGVRECVIEFEDGTGMSIRVHLKGYDATDVVAVGRSLQDAS